MEILKQLNNICLQEQMLIQEWDEEEGIIKHLLITH